MEPEEQENPTDPSVEEPKQPRVDWSVEWLESDLVAYARASLERLGGAEGEHVGLKASRAHATALGLNKITMEEIDAEIAACRQKKRAVVPNDEHSL